MSRLRTIGGASVATRRSRRGGSFSAPGGGRYRRACRRRGWRSLERLRRERPRNSSTPRAVAALRRVRPGPAAHPQACADERALYASPELGPRGAASSYVPRLSVSLHVRIRTALHSGARSGSVHRAAVATLTACLHRSRQCGRPNTSIGPRSNRAQQSGHRVSTPPGRMWDGAGRQGPATGTLTGTRLRGAATVGRRPRAAHDTSPDSCRRPACGQAELPSEEAGIG